MFGVLLWQSFGEAWGMFLEVCSGVLRCLLEGFQEVIGVKNCKTSINIY